MAWIFTIARNLSISKLRLKRQLENVQMDDIENNISFSYIDNHEDKLVINSTFKIIERSGKTNNT